MGKERALVENCEVVEWILNRDSYPNDGMLQWKESFRVERRRGAILKVTKDAKDKFEKR